MNYGSRTSSWKPWRWVRLDLIPTLRDIYTNSNMNLENMFIHYEHYLTLSFTVSLYLFSYVEKSIWLLCLKNKYVVITYPVWNHFNMTLPTTFSTGMSGTTTDKKTVLDPVDGFHAIPLDDSSKKLTTFITEWDRYRNCWLPQGYLAATDAYTRCNNEIIQDVPNKINIVDNTLLHDNDIDTSFYHTWDYLTLCYTKGIMFNKSKFQFCQDTVNFAGLTITSNGITPSKHILSAIKSFPSPKNLTDARSWFCLVNQVA